MLKKGLILLVFAMTSLAMAKSVQDKVDNINSALDTANQVKKQSTAAKAVEIEETVISLGAPIPNKQNNKNKRGIKGNLAPVCDLIQQGMDISEVVNLFGKKAKQVTSVVDSTKKVYEWAVSNSSACQVAVEDGKVVSSEIK